eukprot:243527_1
MNPSMTVMKDIMSHSEPMRPSGTHSSTETYIQNPKNTCTKQSPKLRLRRNRSNSCPEIQYNECREFDAFQGEWIDSKGETALISPWGVIRYPEDPKLRFEAVYLGPNHLSVFFDKDPTRNKFVAKLNHECTLIMWSNGVKWVKKGSKHDPQLHTQCRPTRTTSCTIQ